MKNEKERDDPRPAEDEQLVEADVHGVQNSALIEMRREQICEAALELFLQKGFASTTIRDICAKSGVNQASIYDYIANKNDILRRLLNKLWFGRDVPTLAERLEQDDGASLEEHVSGYLRDAWSKKRKGTLLVYRSVPYLQADDRRTMWARDRAVIETLGKQLRALTHLPEDDPRAEVMANLIVFLAAFAPMRDWLNRDVDDEVILRTVSAGVAAMIERLAEETERAPAEKGE
ncbi:MAG: TetR/AcrR family transcriptional regulator [Ectothiorhodospiraceae bacterium]|nr:TetR/AcrR family transcriptional regulator [Ectothiorhodospiraceae bacterium]MCH8506306.1 TetR/AcrR family transcriptional regulator [Ectothiorhodospiraceae bacterium]